MLKSEWISLLLFLVIVAVIGVIGYAATESSVHSWYLHLIKASWTPPSYIFPPIWAVLYLTIALAGWFAWRRWEEIDSDEFRMAMTLYCIQLALNAVWSVLFFELRAPLFALCDIIVMLLVIAFNIVAFYRIEKLAGWLLVPYLFWVAYATSLNAAIFALNPI
jgi:tryptophan-rich sensory protein